MTDFFLWALIVTAAIMATCNAIITTQQTPEFHALIRAAVSARLATARRAAMLLSLMAFVNLALWTGVSIATGDVRFALIYWMTFLVSSLGRWLMPRRPAVAERERAEAGPSQ